MELFIVHVSAKHGHADDVAKYYADGEAEMKKAKGYRGRIVYQAETGKMVEAVHRFYTPEELANDPEPPHGPLGTDFIVIEYWDSVDERMKFAKERKQDKMGLVVHLEPDHSHEFFTEISNTVSV
jgi:hypothetical protein